MANASVLVGGYLVRTTDFTLTGFNHRSGFLTRFKFKEISYIHVKQVDFKKQDQNKIYASAGYYNETEFLKYKVIEIPPEKISRIKLDLNTLPKGIIGDTVKVRKLKIVAPYTDFCKVNDISWEYKGGSLLDSGLFGIAIPSNAKVTPNDVDVSSEAKSFNKNNVDLINATNFPANLKDSGAYIIAMIALQINNIQKDIFPLFNSAPGFSDYISSQNKEWSSIIVLTKPALKELQDYLNNITAFYNSAYANQVFIKDALTGVKLYWLAYSLSIQGLAIIPPLDKIRILKYMAQGLILERSRMIEILEVLDPTLEIFLAPIVNDEKLVLNILESVKLAPLQSDVFLKQLTVLGFNDGKDSQTLFEILYGKIDDNRVGRIPPGLINDSDNRKQFIILLYDIWKASIYNPYYNSPSYTLHATSNGVFPESFFMTDEGRMFYDAQKSPASLIYSEAFDISAGSLSSSSTNFGFIIDKDRIAVTKIITKSITSNVGEHGQISTDTATLYGRYHLFQPVSIIGYKADLEIVMPKENYIPIFFLYYANDFKSDKDFDFGVLFWAEMALNFIGIGVIGESLHSIGYLKYISKFWRLGEFTPTELVLFWREVKGVNSLIQFTAGSALTIAEYIKNTSTDPDIINFINKLNVFLGVITLGSLSFDSIIKGKAITAANNVIVDINYLATLGKNHSLPQSVINEIKAFANFDELVIAMKGKINSLTLNGVNTIGPKYEAFTLHQDQYDFYAYYYNKHNTDNIWNQLNKQYRIDNGPETRTLVDIWKDDIKISELKSKRSDIGFLSDYNYMMNVEKDVWEHIDKVKNSPRYNGTGFNPIGGHTSNNFQKIESIADLNNLDIEDKFLIFDPAMSGLPVNMRIYNVPVIHRGHIDHENVFVYNANLPASRGEYVIGNRSFKLITKIKTQINPDWEIDKIKGEYAFALSNKVYNKTNETIPKFGQPNNHIIEQYEGSFTDGTKLKIHISNYEWQNGRLYEKYISYMEIKK